MRKLIKKMIFIVFMTMLCAVNLTAQEPPQIHYITVSSNPPQGGVVDGSGPYLYGDIAFLLAIHRIGWNFINWTEEGVEVSTEFCYSFIVESDRNLVANFVQTSYNIILLTDPVAGGTVSGEGVYELGTEVVVTATPNLGFEFTNWTDGNGEEITTEPSFSFTVEGDRILIAHFGITTEPFDITVSANPPECGTVSGGGVYHYGESVMVSAVAHYGFRFKNWTEDGAVVSIYDDYLFTASASRTLVANFAPAIHLVTIVRNPFAGGNVSGIGSYTHGDEVTVSAHANPDYEFVSWTEYGEVLATTPVYTFTILSSRSLVANFVLIEKLSIDPIDAGAMTIYPNPTNSDLTVVLNDAALKITAMELYDLAGKRVHQQTVNKSSGTLKMDELAQGIYVLKVLLDNGETVVQKIIKQ